MKADRSVRDLDDGSASGRFVVFVESMSHSSHVVVGREKNCVCVSVCVSVSVFTEV